MELSVVFDEVEVLNRLKEGDANAYMVIYTHYHRQLYSHVIRYVKVPEIAEDIIQDAFIKLWDVRANIEPQLSIGGYLYRICRNLVYKLMKKIANDAELRSRIIDRIKDCELDLDSRIQWKEYSVLLENAISQLPPQRQRIFKLCRQEGKSYEEVAVLLGISKYTVKEHMVLAMKYIRIYFYKNADIVLNLVALGFLMKK